jgi:hypothetical protein
MRPVLRLLLPPPFPLCLLCPLCLARQVRSRSLNWLVWSVARDRVELPALLVMLPPPPLPLLLPLLMRPVLLPVLLVPADPLGLLGLLVLLVLPDPLGLAELLVVPGRLRLVPLAAPGLRGVTPRRHPRLLLSG